MTITALRRSLEILGPYQDNEYCFGAEHDVFYIYVCGALVPKEEKEELKSLGCYYDTEDDHFYMFT